MDDSWTLQRSVVTLEAGNDAVHSEIGLVKTRLDDVRGALNL